MQAPCMLCVCNILSCIYTIIVKNGDSFGFKARNHTNEGSEGGDANGEVSLSVRSVVVNERYPQTLDIQCFRSGRKYEISVLHPIVLPRWNHNTESFISAVQHRYKLIVHIITTQNMKLQLLYTVDSLTADSLLVVFYH